MKKLFWDIILFGIFIGCSQNNNTDPVSEEDQPKVLVFSKTAGFRHESISDGILLIKQLAADNQFTADFTEDATLFTTDNLSGYQAIVFLNTTLNVLEEEQEEALQKYIRSGGGFAGVHAATDTEMDWPWYGQMVGAFFDGHPAIQEARIEVVDKNHPSTAMLDDVWIHTDEWYNFDSFNEEVNVLLQLDESSYEGGTMGEFHPIAWYHEFEGGRVFYTGLGHVKEAYDDPVFQKHLLGGLQYVIEE